MEKLFRLFSSRYTALALFMLCLGMVMLFCSGCQSGVDVVKALTDDLKNKAVTYEHVDKAIIIKAPSATSESDTTFIELVFGTREVRWSSSPVISKDQTVAPAVIKTDYENVSLMWPAGTIHQRCSLGMPVDLTVDSGSKNTVTK